MKPLILSCRRFNRVPSWMRAPVGLLALAALIEIKDLLDIVWAHFHINQFVADLIVQTAFAPIVVTLIAPMFSFLAPLFHGMPSGNVLRFDCADPFDRGNEVTSHALSHDDFDFQSLHDDSRDWSGRPDSGADWHTDPSYSWFSGNIYCDDPHQSWNHMD
ncbi:MULTISPECIES: hypothetical protein [unclassified Paraburkholderia]|uniref:hypothetical protein n=1 Tax=unclassified Paraburkholderia TaxID=2615204 RepID=UPI001615249C|nr:MULTISPECIES: hypothetical protein [unclassified Paraburkholderia]MBB5441429.1 hypothetical protein [Paraburkholderia sp. WSM4177]MBB5481824.1 hypothetical protein [Paraburkholderia sp. WSM4180]